MCGIVGYIGHREAYPIILKGLKRLEYRGYDSAGVALFDGNDIKLSKTKTLLINSWFLYIRLIHLKWCFSFGVHNQLTGNDTIREILHEPPSEYQLKYGESGPMDDDVFIESNYTSINDKHNQDYKSRTTKVRKARVNKLDEQMEELELK